MAGPSGTCRPARSGPEAIHPLSPDQSICGHRARSGGSGWPSNLGSCDWCCTGLRELLHLVACFGTNDPGAVDGLRDALGVREEVFHDRISFL